MPCYVVQTQSVEFKATNRMLIEDMLKTNHYSYSARGDSLFVSVGYYDTLTIHLKEQRIETTSQSLANRIKREYSEHIVKLAAKKKKWVLKKKGQSKFVAKRW